jgi:hypothetical protein
MARPTDYLLSARAIPAHYNPARYWPYLIGTTIPGCLALTASDRQGVAIAEMTRGSVTLAEVGCD